MSNPINLQYTTIKALVPGFIYDGLKEYYKEANSYQPQPRVLINKLAKKNSISSDTIFITAGEDEAIQILTRAYGKKTYIFTPTYIGYLEVVDFNGTITPISSVKNDEYSISSEKISDATLIFLANPNNPFGYTSKEKIFELIENNPQAIVVIDEAYGEFANFSIVNEIHKYKNAVVLRSFSKGYGMAGIRLGYLVANLEIISKVKNYTQWSNISYLSVGAGMIALDHEDYFSNMRNSINSLRDGLYTFLREKNFTVFQSFINAVTIKFTTSDDSSKFVTYLNDNNILVNLGNVSNTGLDDSYVRIAIGTAEQMSKVKEIINKYV